MTKRWQARRRIPRNSCLTIVFLYHIEASRPLGYGAEGCVAGTNPYDWKTLSVNRTVNGYLNDRDGLRLSYAVFKIRWASNPTASTAIRLWETFAFPTIVWPFAFFYHCLASCICRRVIVYEVTFHMKNREILFTFTWASACNLHPYLILLRHTGEYNYIKKVWASHFLAIWVV